MDGSQEKTFRTRNIRFQQVRQKAEVPQLKVIRHLCTSLQPIQIRLFYVEVTMVIILLQWIELKPLFFITIPHEGVALKDSCIQ